MKRVMFMYPDGERVVGEFSTTEGDHYFTLGGERFSVDDIKKTDAVIVVSDAKMFRLYTELGLSVRPSTKLTPTSLAFSRNTKLRLQDAAKKEGKSISALVESIVTDWLDTHGY